ncbi:MAG: histidine phosphatase family protein [Clostridia bacterium]|nr:histidine phosphatase family protein [Clostridia bacterium]
MAMPKKLFEMLLVRHAQSRGNAGMQGSTVRERQDPDLSDNGLVQAQFLADRVQYYPLDALFSSGLERAVHTAAVVAKMQPENGARTVEVLPLLTECNTLENYTGRTMNAIQAAYPCAVFAKDTCSSDTVLPNDETVDEQYNIERACDALAYFKNRFRNGERVMVVSHGIFNTVFLMQALGISEPIFDPDFQNTSITRLSFYEKGTGPWGFDVQLHCLNDCSHLFGSFPQIRFEYKGDTRI